MDTIFSKYLKILAIFIGTILFNVIYLSNIDKLSYLGDIAYVPLFLITIFGPIIAAYFWIRDTKKGKIFYSVLVPIFGIVILALILIFVLSAWSGG